MPDKINLNKMMGRLLMDEFVEFSIDEDIDYNEDINYNNEKFKSVMHYIINKSCLNTNVERTAIYTLLYFADFDFYELYERSMTGETYIRKPIGSVPIHFTNAKNELINEGKIKEKTITYYKYEYSSLKEPDTSLLNNEDLTVIKDTINKLSNMTINELSNYNKGDLPWRVAENKDELGYEFVFYRNPEYSIREYD